MKKINCKELYKQKKRNGNHYMLHFGKYLQILFIILFSVKKSKSPINQFLNKIKRKNNLNKSENNCMKKCYKNNCLGLKMKKRILII